eukprot:277877-Prymnesium_polylepis.1
MFDELKVLEPDGFTLEKAIKPAINNPNESVGIVAGSPSSYDHYRKVFDPLIEELHSGFDPTTTIHSTGKGPPPLSAHPELRSALSSLETCREVSSIRFHATRSIVGLPLLPATNSESRREVMDAVKIACEALGDEFRGSFRPFDALDNVEFQELLAAGNAFPEPAGSLLKAVGAADEWPKSRAVFYNSDRDRALKIAVNESEHMSVDLELRGNDVEAAYGTFVKLLTTLEDSLKAQKRGFAWHERLGWVGFSPAQLGTALRVSIHIKLVNGQEADNEEEQEQAEIKEAAKEAGKATVADASRSGEKEGATVTALIHQLEGKKTEDVKVEAKKDEETGSA